MLDVLSLTRDIIALIKDHQIETAGRLAHQADRQREIQTGMARSEAILQINIKLQQLKEQRNVLRQTVQSLPEKERSFAEVQIEEIIDRIYAAEIAALKAQKRTFSRPVTI